ncbi:hypothetical protein TrST_g12937 [Triparma strigata]|uniref:O-acyltransferase WSD1 C-terminal domain-containing protein n=1 Tax=Triparma strigata TaxID=1606541 RepID=A0A9W7BPY4_9STRA|nr:hypothetical protein TrST_g12937 [Triparma strigata]
MLSNLAKILPLATAVAACNEIEDITSSIKLEPAPEISQMLANIEHKRCGGLPAPALKRRTTSIGRLAHLTSTASNPSVVSFFVTLSGDTGLTSSSFATTFSSRILASPRYSRFASTLSPDSQTFTSKDVSEILKSLVSDTVPPSGRLETSRIIESMIYAPLPLSASGEPFLWSARVCQGPITSTSPGFNLKTASEAIESGRTEESYIFFKASHILGDGVSLGNVLIDLSDEAPELNQKITDMVKRRRRRGGGKRGFLQKLVKAFRKLAWFIAGCFKFFKHQLLLTLDNRRNPFEAILRSAKEANRTLSWTTSPIPLTALKKICGHYNCTVNDLFVTCVSLAVKRQLRELGVNGGEEGKNIGVVIPVHLQGGVLLEGQSIGNRIGAVNASIGVEGNDRTKALVSAKGSLKILKETPAPLISYLMAKVITLPFVPVAVASMGLKFGIGGACVAISNVRGPESKLHIDGRTVENVVGFVPPPPGVPIGVVVQSYNGGVCLSVNGDGRCVPDGDKFLAWVLQELGGYAEEVNRAIE